MMFRIEVWCLVALDGGVTYSRRFGGTHRLHLHVRSLVLFNPLNLKTVHIS